MLQPNTSLHRRTCLAGFGAAAVGVFNSPHALAASDLNSQTDLQARGLQSNGIEVTMPPLADNGNAIPFQFTLQAPAGKQLVGLDIIAPENPNRVILRLKFGQAQTRFKFSTRIRLAGTQDLVALARLSNGEFRYQKMEIIVTESACVDAS